MILEIPAEIDERMRGLPAEAMVRKGLADFGRGEQSLESLLVQIGAPRLREAGLPIIREKVDMDADYRLYDLLCKTHDNEAHSQYNSLIRELVSFERGLERRNSSAGMKV
jgi:hypothetical protein